MELKLAIGLKSTKIASKLSMHVLPIHLLSAEEQKVFGDFSINLSKLARQTQAIPKGIIIAPPIEEIILTLAQLEINSPQDFEGNKIALEKKLIQNLKFQEIYHQIQKETKYYQKIFDKLVNRWLDQIHSHLQRFEGIDKKNLHLTAYPVFELEAIVASGRAYLDKISDQVAIETKDLLNIEQQVQLDGYVRQAEKILLLPHSYTWVFDGYKIWIIDAKFQTGIKKIVQTNKLPVEQKSESIKHKKAIKLFINLKEHFTLFEHADGVVIEPEGYKSEDELLFALVESCASMGNRPVIFKIPMDNINLLKSYAKNILFIRNNKKFSNLQICLTGGRGVDQILEAKRELASLGVARKGSLVFWYEFSTPESLLNIDSYIEAGIDGASVSLDLLATHLFAKPIEDLVLVDQERASSTIIKILSEPIKSLHKLQLPICFSGKIAFHETMLDYLISKGVWALEAQALYQRQIDQHLSIKEYLNLQT